MIRTCLDQNLSPRLVEQLSDLFPQSAHVANFNLERAKDIEIWNFAKENNFILISKDSDFSEISEMRSFPPNIVWIRKGNCSTNEIEEILKRDYGRIETLLQSEEAGLLLLY